MTPLADLTAIVCDTLRAYERCFNEQRITDLRALWDASESSPIYVAEEVASTLVGWEAIEGYWAGTQAALKRVSIRAGEPELRTLAPDLVLAHFPMHWNAEVRTGDALPGKLFGGDVRVSALFRCRGGRALFIHYIEAPVGALPFLQGIYAGAVDAEFARAASEPAD